MSNESDPHGTDQHKPGSKLDAGKPEAGLLCDFGLALMAVADVATFGARKYTRRGWLDVPDGHRRYTDAMLRHILKSGSEAHDQDSTLAHSAHIAWNALARLELELRANRSTHE